ncbi:mammaglobin-B-like [Sorex fumeus]|uniref:mammaglobin-B-like n=1 Tax=Sorex fumeus TaxID=62283 RepID=UPI0024AE3A6F|nr:mammaglobin-B-like [Sorex fumeus]
MKLLTVLMLTALPLFCYAGYGCLVLEEVVEKTVDGSMTLDAYIDFVREFLEDEDIENAIRSMKTCFNQQSLETLDNYRMMMVT